MTEKVIVINLMLHEVDILNEGSLRASTSAKWVEACSKTRIECQYV